MSEESPFFQDDFSAFSKSRPLRCGIIMTAIYCATILFSPINAYSNKEPAVSYSGRLVKDDYYHFQLQLPNAWRVKLTTNAESQSRVRAFGRGNRDMVVYAVHSKLIIDAKKLTGEGNKLLKDTGTLESTKHLPDSFFVPWLVDEKGLVKTFKKDDLYTILFVQAEGPYGYIAILRGPDIRELRDLLATFKATVPVKETGYALVNYLSVFILAALLGESGFSFRKRLFKLRVIKSMCANAPLPDSIMKERRRTIVMLYFAPLWCLLLYLLGTYFLVATTRRIFIDVGVRCLLVGYA